jgi:hypothetical protein
MSPRLPDDQVLEMHRFYADGASLSATARRYGRCRASIREVFVRRGLFVRPPPCRIPPRRANGQILPARVHTERELVKIAAGMERIRIPDFLSVEWRKWSLEKRGWFIGLIRTRLNSPHDRPRLPLSPGLVPFNYATPAAQKIAAEINKGLSSRAARVKIDLISEGVIFRGQLWFWNHKVGYQRGPWTAEGGRPALHQVIWQEANGRAVPAHHVIRFADGNRNNHSPVNLVLAHRNEVARENQATALFRKSRERTRILLDRIQRIGGRSDLTTKLHRQAQ